MKYALGQQYPDNPLFVNTLKAIPKPLLPNFYEFRHRGLICKEYNESAIKHHLNGDTR